jgi:hypothetical protein
MAERDYKIPISLIEKVVCYAIRRYPNVVVDFSVKKIERRDKSNYRILLDLNPELSIENYENNLQVFQVYKSIHYYLDRILNLNKNKVRVSFSHHFFKVTPLNHTIIYRTPVLHE